MSGFAVFLAEALLLLTVFGVRRTPAQTARRDMLLQGAVLCACLSTRLADGGGQTLLCLAAVLLELVLLTVRAGRWDDSPAMLRSSGPGPSLWPMAACVLTIWLAFRLVPSGHLPAVSLGIVLCGAVGLLAARGDRARWTSLLFCGHGVVLFAGTVPGPGWPGVLMALSLQALPVFALCRRPVWSDVPAAGVE